MNAVGVCSPAATLQPVPAHPGPSGMDPGLHQHACKLRNGMWNAQTAPMHHARADTLLQRPADDSRPRGMLKGTLPANSQPIPTRLASVQRLLHYCTISQCVIATRRHGKTSREGPEPARVCRATDRWAAAAAGGRPLLVAPVA